MNARKAASRMRSRTAVSSPFWRRFDTDAVAITLSLTTLVPHRTITGVRYPMVPTHYESREESVGVGIMFAHNPLHGSGQAGFPHPALALGEDAHAAQGVGMTDGRRRQPASEEAPHAVPEEAAGLAAPRQRAIPEAPDLKPKEK